MGFLLVLLNFFLCVIQIEWSINFYQLLCESEWFGVYLFSSVYLSSLFFLPVLTLPSPILHCQPTALSPSSSLTPFWTACWVVFVLLDILFPTVASVIKPIVLASSNAEYIFTNCVNKFVKGIQCCAILQTILSHFWGFWKSVVEIHVYVLRQ